MLSRAFVCLGSVSHNVKLLKSGFNNSCLISQSGVSVTYRLLVMYLKIGLEDASPSCLWSQHLWRSVEASKLPFISSWLQERGKVRGDLNLAHHHMFLYLSCLLCTLALGTDYHQKPATVTPTCVASRQHHILSGHPAFLHLLLFLCSRSSFSSFTSLTPTARHLTSFLLQGYATKICINKTVLEVCCVQLLNTRTTICVLFILYLWSF